MSATAALKSCKAAMFCALLAINEGGAKIKEFRNKPGPATQHQYVRLQLPLEFVEEASIRVFGNQLLRARLDQARLV
jgi:hypothetical protein